MEYNFNHSAVEQVYDDFTYSKGDYTDVMDAGLKDLDSAVKSVKNRNDGFAVSDDIAALMAECNGHFGIAFNAATAAEREKWLPQLADVLVSAVELNPRNAESILQSALKLEQAYEGSDSGILLKVADKISFRYPEHLPAVLKTVDEHLQNYEQQPKKDAAVYKSFYKVYTNAVRKTRSAEMRDKASTTANDIFGQIELLKGNVTVEKLLQRVMKNPNEATIEAFEKDLNTLMAQNPQSVAEIQPNLKSIAQLEKPDTRAEVNGLMIDAFQHLPQAETPDALKERSTQFYSIVDEMLRREKDENARRTVAVTATYALKRAFTDENGALIFAEGQEKQAFNTLNRIADGNGGRFGLKEMLVKTAEKYRKSPEIAEMTRACMLKVLDADEKFQNPVEGERSPYEVEMLAHKRNRDNRARLDKQIYTLLNIPSKSLGVERDPSKPFYPSKADMRRVVNLLSQYRKIEYGVALSIFGKMDNEKFTNIDDKILDTVSNVTSRMQYKEEFIEKLTEMRTQMHAFGIREKKKNAANDKTAQIVSMKDGKDAGKPSGQTKFTIDFSDINHIEK